MIRMPVGEAMRRVDVRALERELTLATRSWDDEFADLIVGWTMRPACIAGGRAARGLQGGLHPTPGGPGSDRAAGARGCPRHVDGDVCPGSPRRRGELRLKIFRREASLSLSKIMPHLSLLGVDVIDERPYELVMGEDQRGFIYDFGVRVPGGADAVRSRWTPEARQRFMDAFSASYVGDSESDGFNALVMGADFTGVTSVCCGLSAATSGRSASPTARAISPRR